MSGRGVTAARSRVERIVACPRPFSGATDVIVTAQASTQRTQRSLVSLISLYFFRLVSSLSLRLVHSRQTPAPAPLHGNDATRARRERNEHPSWSP